MAVNNKNRAALLLWLEWYAALSPRERVEEMARALGWVAP
jgi:hypothetical protein